MEPLLKRISEDIGIIKNELYELREEIDSLRLVIVNPQKNLDMFVGSLIALK